MRGWVAVAVIVAGCSVGVSELDTEALSPADAQMAEEAFRTYQAYGCFAGDPSQVALRYDPGLSADNYVGFTRRLGLPSMAVISLSTSPPSWWDSRSDWWWDGESDCNGGYDLETTILHEMGHAAGLRHVSDPSAVMYGTQYTCAYEGVSVVRRDFTAEDLAELARACR